MSVLSKLLGTFQTTFQIGKAGPKVKNNGGVIEARNAADSAYADVKAAQSQFTTALVNGNAQIKATAGGQVTFRDAADTADAKIFAADPLITDLQGLVTVNYFNTNPPTSAPVLRVAVIKSGSYATTYQTTVTVPNAAIVTRAVLRVVTGLDAGITLKIGTDEGAGAQDSRFQGTGDNDPQTAGIYDVSPFLLVKTTGGGGSDQDLVVTLSALPTVGEAYVFIEYVVPTAI